MVGYEYLKNFLKEENFHYDENDWLINFKVKCICDKTLQRISYGGGCG